jgi:hypothetical protein
MICALIKRGGMRCRIIIRRTIKSALNRLCRYDPPAPRGQNDYFSLFFLIQSFLRNLILQDAQFVTQRTHLCQEN